MDTLTYILNKYGVESTEKIMLPIGRFKDIPKLFKELGFTKGYEIGVYRAKYSQKLLDYNPELHLTGVDAWEIYGGYKDYEVTDIIDAHRESEETYKRYGDRATLIQGWSRDVASKVQDGSLDFVFIDANHAYEYCVEDIALWSKKVRKGGIVYGHDYDDYSKHHKRWNQMHVIDAVDGWCRSYRIKPLFITTNNTNKCWMYVK